MSIILLQLRFSYIINIFQEMGKAKAADPKKMKEENLEKAVEDVISEKNGEPYL